MPLGAYFLLGMGIGFVFPILGVGFDTLLKGEPFNFSYLFAKWNGNLPLVMRIAATIGVGCVCFGISRLNRKRRLEQEAFSESLYTYSRELEAKNQKLSELNDAMDGLIYSASHELRTPLVNMESLLTMMGSIQNRPDAEAMREEILQKMEKSIGQFKGTITDMMDVARLERQFEIDSLPLDFRNCLNVVLEKLSDLIEGKDAVLEIEVDQGLMVEMPVTALEGLLRNLISNALTFSRAEVRPKVKIAGNLTGKTVCIEISDNGIGINLSDHEEKLFRMFTRLHKSSQGNGVGLYLVKRTVDLAGGKIEVESRVGEGTLFN